MSTCFNPNRGFQGDDFQSGSSICKSMDLNEYYNTQYTPMFDGKGGAAKKSSSTTKKVKRAPSKKRGGADDLFADFEARNISLPYATQAGGTQLASEYYTSAQQGSYAPYNASKDEKCGGCKKRVIRGGFSMPQAEGIMNQKKSNMDESMAAANITTSGGCGCGYKPKTSGTKRGGSDGYYTDTVTGNDPVVEKISKLDGQLNGGTKSNKRSSSKGAKKPKTKSSSSKGAKKPKTKSSSSKQKLKGGDDSAGVGSDFATTLASRGPCNYPDGKSADLFRIFNKTSEFIPNSMLKYAAAPISTGYSPDPNPYPRAYNDDFIGGKKKPTKKSSSSKSKAKKPVKKSTSSKTKTKKH
jgi:hypothetical protein